MATVQYEVLSPSAAATSPAAAPQTSPAPAQASPAPESLAAAPLAASPHSADGTDAQHNPIKKKLEQILAQAEQIMSVADNIHKVLTTCCGDVSKDLAHGTQTKNELEAVMAEAPPKLRAALEVVRELAEDCNMKGMTALLKMDRSKGVLQDSIDAGKAANKHLKHIIERMARLKPGEDLDVPTALIFSAMTQMKMGTPAAVAAFKADDEAKESTGCRIT